jgi:hypothetical protein
MNDTSITTATLDQTDEEILTSTVSDEALEAAGGTEGTGSTGTVSLHLVADCC